MKKIVYFILALSMVLTACSEKRTDLSKITFKEKVSTLLYGANTLNDISPVTGFTVLQTNEMNHYSFGDIDFASGNSDTASTIVSNVRFHIAKDSSVKVVLLDLHRSEEGLKFTDYLMKNLGKPIKSKMDPYVNDDKIKIGYSGHYWESKDAKYCYFVQNSYYQNADKTQGYDMMLYIVGNDDQETKAAIANVLLSF